MSDIFISYARSTEGQARQVAEALRALGYGVWRDDELPAHRDYSEVIEERLRAAKAVVVVWSAEAVKSQWVRAEADLAREAGTLVQLTLDSAPRPMPFNRIQCADMNGWSGDLQAPGWRKVVASVGELMGGAAAAASPPAAPRKHSICVLPFANMSDDPQQEYFSDGITEDIITDLSKVSALSVVARNTAFTFKGKSVDVPMVARQLNVGHVLEGSVRRAGGRVRITAQLIDAAVGDHVWAERWDRDLTDIFALQDEIAQAVVGALKLKLLPEEKESIERRGTNNVDAYNLYLMARQYELGGNIGDVRRAETIERLCRAAVDIDPGYARAWALMATAQRILHFWFRRPGDAGLAAAEQALQLDPDLAEAHAVKARRLAELGRHDEADGEIEAALRLDPDSFEVNSAAAFLSFENKSLVDAIGYFERATVMAEADVSSPGMLVGCYTAVGDADGIRRSSLISLARAEKALAQDPSNGSAMGYAVCALGALGEAERARDWARRALLIDPDNRNMRYNLACGLSIQLRDAEGALELLGPWFARASQANLNHAKVDGDFDPIRDHPRFQAMLAAAEARLAAANQGGSAAS